MLKFYFIFKEYVGLLGETVRKEQNEDFLIEVVGTLGNLNITDIDYEALLKEYDLVNWIKAMLQPGLILLFELIKALYFIWIYILYAIKGEAEDDLVLDIIVLIGAVCNDDACANLLSKSGIIDILIEMLNGNF
jgi:hypothetical protein